VKPEPATQAAAAIRIGTFEELVALAADRRDLQVKAALERDVRVVRCEDGKLEISLEPGASQALVSELSAKLSGWTGRQWFVTLSREPGQPTLKSQADARDAEIKRGVRADPLVQAVLERFPGAEIIAVRARDAGPTAGGDMPSEDFPPEDQPPYDDDNDNER
jgi:DNA polymerase-3 subunit gamma/tau